MLPTLARRIGLGIACLALAAPAGPTRADDQPELDRISTRAGIPFHQVETWSSFSSRTINPTDTELHPLVEVTIGDRANIGFGSRVWVPAAAQIDTLLPVYPIVGAGHEGHGNLDVSGRLIDDSGERARAVGSEQQTVVPLREPGFFSGMIAGGDRSDWLTNSAGTLRELAGLARTTAYFSAENAPYLPAQWRILDTMAIGTPEPEMDAAQLEALRQWVYDGGRLWIALDVTDPRFPAELLGEHWNVAVIDRAWQREFAFEDADGETIYTRTFDYPQDMLRVIAPDMEVIHSVDGHPASLRKSIGRGELLVTTVTMRAWMDEDGDEATPPLEELAWFVSPAREQPRQGQAERLAAMDRYLNEQIGYTIMGRGTVLTVLGLFLAALLGTGFFLARRDRLEWIGVLGIVFAFLGAGTLVALGYARQGEHPTALASVQMIEPIPGTSHAAVASRAAIYRPQVGPASVELSGEANAPFWPDRTAEAGQRTQMVWDAVDRWRFPGFSLPAGAARSLSSYRLIETDQPLVARLSFGEGRIVSEVEGADGYGELSDAVIGSRYGHIAADASAGGTLMTTAGDRLAADQFIRAGLLSQTQISRQEVYRRIMAEPDYPSGPRLLAWAPGPEPGLAMDTEAEKPRQSLFAIPIEIERPEPGAEVFIPQALMPRERFRHEMLDRATGVFDVERQEFVPSITHESTVMLQWEVPEALQPLELEELELRMNLQAPGWQYEIVRFTGDGVEPVHQGRNPMGSSTITLSGDDLPQVLEDGRIPLGLRMEHGQDATAQPEPWSLRQFEIAVRGRVSE